MKTTSLVICLESVINTYKPVDLLLKEYRHCKEIEAFEEN